MVGARPTHKKAENLKQVGNAVSYFVTSRFLSPSLLTTITELFCSAPGPFMISSLSHSYHTHS